MINNPATIPSCLAIISASELDFLSGIKGKDMSQ